MRVLKMKLTELVVVSWLTICAIDLGDYCIFYRWRLRPLPGNEFKEILRKILGVNEQPRELGCWHL